MLILSQSSYLLLALHYAYDSKLASLENSPALGPSSRGGPQALGASEPLGPQALGVPRLSLVSLVGNPPLVGGPQIGEFISSIKGIKKELLQKTAS
jgi:hypothetical protein